MTRAIEPGDWVYFTTEDGKDAEGRVIIVANSSLSNQSDFCIQLKNGPVVWIKEKQIKDSHI